MNDKRPANIHRNTRRRPASVSAHPVIAVRDHSYSIRVITLSTKLHSHVSSPPEISRQILRRLHVILIWATQIPGQTPHSKSNVRPELPDELKTPNEPLVLINICLLRGGLPRHLHSRPARRILHMSILKTMLFQKLGNLGFASNLDGTGTPIPGEIKPNKPRIRTSLDLKLCLNLLNKLFLKGLRLGGNLYVVDVNRQHLEIPPPNVPRT
mmetsp:Transcript_23515/g.35350  ORF Transcript_23515/g.35350 Transcript_23515/m.35350 type:complete len:211 (-) Transcript_23515:929-1561(-)